ncbi:hypothetical protein A9Q81_11955 [Gammaproteobacteria bacterium 42_54_T18]|nr:hypothetical protein A9Q81_11955 [Gammaproteobacteria bacterium 42_54_T18]
MKTESLVIACGDQNSLKLSSLLADYIIPIELDSNSKGGYEATRREYPASIIPPEYRVKGIKEGQLIDLIPYYGGTISELSQRFYETFYGYVRSNLFVDNTTVDRFTNHAISLLNVGSSSLFKNATISLPISINNAGDGDTTSMLFTFENLNLIDTTDVEWRHVEEFKKDKESLAKLRDLRWFYKDNYSGKSLEEIKDRLESLVDSHDRAMNAWGFRLTPIILTELISSPAIMNFAISLFAMSQGMPVGSSVSAYIFLEAVRVYFKVEESKSNLSTLARAHPLAYIDDINNIGK